jgi:hypothetical protein
MIRCGWSVVVLLLLIQISTLWALDLTGRLSVWQQQSLDPLASGEAAIRYLPSLEHGWSLTGAHRLDIQAGANGMIRFPALDRGDERRGDVYRLWLRWTHQLSEVRLGRQKISFGSAHLLRPLMWFDRIDPRDPVAFTEGVDALLIRHTFSNNANVWGWLLYGQGETKGMEIVPTAAGDLEGGGRLQVPAGPGELALSVHHRPVSASPLMLDDDDGYESRMGLDGTWDIELGVWFESAFSRLQAGGETLDRLYATVGSDYTLAMGNGLHLLTEHMEWRLKSAVLDESGRVSLISADYPLGWSDHVYAYAILDWRTEQLYGTLQWQRTGGHWTGTLGLFWTPNTTHTLPVAGTGITGSGVQMMLVFHH